MRKLKTTSLCLLSIHSARNALRNDFFFTIFRGRDCLEKKYIKRESFATKGSNELQTRERLTRNQVKGQKIQFISTHPLTFEWHHKRCPFQTRESSEMVQ